MPISSFSKPLQSLLKTPSDWTADIRHAAGCASATFSHPRHGTIAGTVIRSRLAHYLHNGLLALGARGVFHLYVSEPGPLPKSVFLAEIPDTLVPDLDLAAAWPTIFKADPLAQDRLATIRLLGDALVLAAGHPGRTWHIGPRRRFQPDGADAIGPALPKSLFDGLMCRSPITGWAIEFPHAPWGPALRLFGGKAPPETSAHARMEIFRRAVEAADARLPAALARAVRARLP